MVNRAYRRRFDKRMINGRGFISNLKKLAKSALKFNDKLSRDVFNPALTAPLALIPGSQGSLIRSLIKRGLAGNEFLTRKASELAGNGLFQLGVKTPGAGLTQPGVGSGVLSKKNKQILNKLLGNPSGRGIARV